MNKRLVDESQRFRLPFVRSFVWISQFSHFSFFVVFGVHVRAHPLRIIRHHILTLTLCSFIDELQRHANLIQNTSKTICSIYSCTVHHMETECFVDFNRSNTKINEEKRDLLNCRCNYWFIAAALESNRNPNWAPASRTKYIESCKAEKAFIFRFGSAVSHFLVSISEFNLMWTGSGSRCCN